MSGILIPTVYQNWHSFIDVNGFSVAQLRCFVEGVHVDDTLPTYACVNKKSDCSHVKSWFYFFQNKVQ